MKKSNSISKINKSKSGQKKEIKPRINYKNKYKEAIEKIYNLEINLAEQKKQNQINVDAFHNKAKSFQSTAQKKVNEFKKLLNKEVSKEKENLKKYGSQEMLKFSLEKILFIEIAIKTGEKDPNVSDYVKGFKMLVNQLYENFEKYGVKKIIPKINEDFNSEIHNAIETCKGQKNKILEVKKIGFMLYDRVLFPADVVIGK